MTPGDGRSASYRALLRDLAAEQDDLDGVVSALRPEQWAAGTPAEGWAVRDQIFHLAHYDKMGVLAMRDIARFTTERDVALRNPAAYEADHVDQAARLTPAEQREDWRRARVEAGTELGRRAAAERIAWFGPPMSAMSFATARLMEVWAHGQDIVDALGLPRVPTDRIYHVAHLGVLTRSWSFTVRGLAPPEFDVFIELTAPSGTPWAWGSAGGPQSVRGDAVEFALVVTQRRALEDTDLVISGEDAARWMGLAQAFAGGPGQGRVLMRAGQRPATSHQGHHG